jgi:hypothetical protein
MLTPAQQKLNESLSTLSKEQQTLNDLVLKFGDASPLDSQYSFVDEMTVPMDLSVALLTGRNELLALARPRAITAEEHAVLLKLIGGLIRTNQALREHSSQVAQVVDNWMSQFKGLSGVANQIGHFANFRPIPDKSE